LGSGTGAFMVSSSDMDESEVRELYQMCS